MPKVNKIGHVVLNVRNTEESLKFYTEALGMEVMVHNPERHMAFLSFGTQHHDIALFQAPEGVERGELGLNHIAMQIDGGLDELRILHQRLIDCGAQITNLSEHNVTSSVYFEDPDGNRLEVFSEKMEMEEARRAMRGGGGGARPLVLDEATAR